MASAKMAARSRQHKGLRWAFAVATLVTSAFLTGCIGGGGESGADGPNVGFDPVVQGPTALQFTPAQLGAFISTGGNTPGPGG